MTDYIYINDEYKLRHFTQIPNFLFEDEAYTILSNEAKILYAMILRRTILSRQNGWADNMQRIYIYYPILELTRLLGCGRQKAVNIMRELQNVGLVVIKKQGCGKPNRIYPMAYTVYDAPNSRIPFLERQKS